MFRIIPTNKKWNIRRNKMLHFANKNIKVKHRNKSIIFSKKYTKNAKKCSQIKNLSFLPNALSHIEP